MGAYWLHSALQPLREALGSKFKLYPDYDTRSSRHGGFNGIWGIVMHHDADQQGGSDDWVIDYEYKNARDKPIGNFHVQRDGDVWWGAAGASNHAGKGGPVPTSRGTVPLNQGNWYLIGIEASNDGMGEEWNSTQMNSYLTLVTTLCKHFRLDPLKDIYAHWTWCEPSCPGRKIDPRGPTPSYPKFGGTSGTNKWNMNEVRKEVNARIKTSTPIPPTPPSPPSSGPKPKTKGALDMVAVMKFGGTPNANWGGWYSFDGATTRYAVRDQNHASLLVALGAVDAKDRKKVANADWSDVSHTNDTNELNRLLGQG